MTDYTPVGKGLSKLFIAEILAILSFIPLLGGILAIIALVLMLIGLNEASQAADGYRTAFTLSIASIVVEILGLFIPFMSLVGSILSFAVTYVVCTTTADILDWAGDPATAAKGRFVWKLYVVCTIIIVVCGVVAMIPGLAVLAGLVLIPTVIASIVAGVQYLIFLYRASNFLA